MCCLVGHDEELGFDSSCKKKPLEGLEQGVRCHWQDTFERSLWLPYRRCTVWIQDWRHRHTEQLGSCSKTTAVNTRLRKR